ncbi:MAG: hypothetical protein GY787_05700 [Alteromonadales bacterium]|nr:hypothetical protein [Alteromonadales bacterium]
MMKAYKLFRLLKDNSIAPLFINKKQRLEEGVWYQAENHPTKGFAPRAGWHCCYNPIAPHLSMELKSGEKRVWVEVDVEEVTKVDRPASQGGAWVLAERMKVVKRLPEITNTKGDS